MVVFSILEVLATQRHRPAEALGRLVVCVWEFLADMANIPKLEVRGIRYDTRSELVVRSWVSNCD
jgi:hypothetical protein